MDNIRKVCETIKSRDPTFKYSITEPKIPSLKRKFESLLMIHSSTQEEANRRGGWFIHKCKNAKLSGYFWVKES